VNRGAGDFSPLFMTANHCVSAQGQASSLEAFWNYVTPNCNGTPPNFNTVARTDGAQILKRHTNTDWTLLGLWEPPGANFYIGWDAGNWASNNAATGVHHPRGTFKRISTGSSAGSTNGSLFCDNSGTVNCNCTDPTITTCISVNVWNVSYASGTTEPGSSGSPIFDSASRMRGTLTGGPGGCAPITARYGRFDQAYTNLRYYMNNADIPATTVFVNGGFAGDPGNNGNTERGTPVNPFNQVYEATFCVRSGQTVTVTPGTYNQQMTIWRPMTITRNGTSGIVRIGAP
jgi:lysyl endopeptidase